MPAPFAVSVTIKAIDEVTKTINKVTGNISRQSDALKKFDTQMQSMSGARSISNALNDLKAESTGIFNSLESKRLFAGFDQGFERAKKGFNLLASAAKQSVNAILTTGFAIGGLGFASSRVFGDLSRKNADLKLQASQLNVSPALLRSYRLAAQSVGISSNQIDTTFRKLNSIGADLRMNNPSSAAPLYALPGGVRILDNKLQQRAPNLLLREISDKLNTKGISQSTKIILSEQGLGGSEILPFTELGSQGISKLVGQFNNISDEDLKRSDEANKKYLRANSLFQSSLDKLGNTAAITILPGISKGLEGISQWVETHGKEIKQIFSDLGESIPAEMNAALTFINFFAASLAFLSKHVGLARIAITLFSLTLLFKVGSALKQNWSSIIKQVTFAWNGLTLAFRGIGIVLASPFTWLIVAITILIVTIYALYKHWDLFKSKFSQFKKKLLIWNDIKSAFIQFKNQFSITISEMINDLGNYLNKGKKAFIDFFSWRSGNKINLELSQSSKSSESKNISNLDVSKTNSSKNDFLDVLFNQIQKTKQSYKNQEKQSAELTVRFENTPKGTRIDEPIGNLPININAGHILVGGAF